MGVLLQSAASSPPEGAFGSAAFSLLSALCALALLAALTWLVLRLRTSAALRGSANLRIEERVALDLKGSLLIVRVDSRRLLLATSDRGPARLLAELAPAPASTEPLLERETR